jgi:uncharacterized membrane protein YkvA (DUF1232 family)
MSLTEWFLISVAASLALYLVFILLLVLLDRRLEARALARFIPDCIVLLRRLLGDKRVPRKRKLVLLALIGYLSVPIDLVPDFIPVVGVLDDVLIAALALRYALRGWGPDGIRQHWPGPDASLNAVLRVAYGKGGRTPGAQQAP